MKSSTIRRSTLSRETMEVIENLSKDNDGVPNEYVRSQETAEENSTPSDITGKAQEIDLLWQNFKSVQFNTNSPAAYVTGGFVLGVVTTLILIASFGFFMTKSASGTVSVPKKSIFSLESLNIFAHRKSSEPTLEQQTGSVENTVENKVTVPAEDDTQLPAATTAQNNDGLQETSSNINTQNVKKYVVKSGDTGESIIKHYYGSWSQEKADLVMKANNLTNFDRINIGQELIIPVEE